MVVVVFSGVFFSFSTQKLFSTKFNYSFNRCTCCGWGLYCGVWRLAPVMSRKEIKRINGYGTYVKELAKVREELYKEYFKQLHHSDD